MTPAQTIKALFKEAKKTNPKLAGMKKFAATLKGDDASLAKEWKANKAGKAEKKAKEARRKNKAGVLLEMKLAKTSKKGGDGKKK